MILYYNPKWFDDKQLVVGPDWPFSLGYKFYLISDHPLVRSEHRVKARLIRKMQVPTGCEACHGTWDEPRTAAVVIPASGNVNTLRFIELVVHETSHAVDGFLERSHIEHVDTEVRAYLNDWLVGKILAMTKLHK